VVLASALSALLLERHGTEQRQRSSGLEQRRPEAQRCTADGARSVVAPATGDFFNFLFDL
jgi:hypothetical protein